MNKIHTSQVKGRGAQYNPANHFLKHHDSKDELGIIDDFEEPKPQTSFLTEHAKHVLNKVNSPDLPLELSLNPYQGCEHGCVYCYARNSHEYYGYSAGLDFETKIIVKKNVGAVLQKEFDSKKYVPGVVMLSGNTDCYQPAERKFKLTRRILEICLEYRNPVSIITKNALILRDLDLIKQLSDLNLIHVNVSITTLDESLRAALEPRTTTAEKRLSIIEKLSAENIPVRVMAAPMIPFLNSHELPQILKQSAEAGALDAGYQIVRLNGAIGAIFTDWVSRFYPDKKERILQHIKSAHGGKLSDSRLGVRMKGEGNFAESMSDLFKKTKSKFFNGRRMPEYDKSLFRIPNGQLTLGFD
jgi:DNA repair photolyase